jgi:hypothetical protein
MGRMDLLIATKIGLAIFEALATADLVRITWLALKRQRLSVPLGGLAIWLFEKRLGEAVVKQNLDRYKHWVRPYGYMSLFATVLMLYLLVDEILEIAPLLAGQR